MWISLVAWLGEESVGMKLPADLTSMRLTFRGAKIQWRTPWVAWPIQPQRLTLK